MTLLGEEIARDAQGQSAVLDRLLDLALIAALRAWLARPEAEAPAWYRASAERRGLASTRSEATEALEPEDVVLVV